MNFIAYLLLGLDTSSNAIAFYKIQSSQQAEGSENKRLLPPGAITPRETLTLPKSLATSSWVVSEPVGLAEIQLICSREPFTQASAYSMDALIPGFYTWFGSVKIRIGGSEAEETYPGTIHSFAGVALVLPGYRIFSTYQGDYHP